MANNDGSAQQITQLMRKDPGLFAAIIAGMAEIAKDEDLEAMTNALADILEGNDEIAEACWKLRDAILTAYSIR